MDRLKNMSEKFKEVIKNKRNNKYFSVVILGLIGITLIFLSELFYDQSSEADNPEVKNRISNYNEQNKQMMEKRLSDAVSKINGAGKTEIMITFDSSEEYLYAENYTESKNENETEKESEFVIIEGEKEEVPLIIKTFEPKIRGVLVICEGGENPVIKEKIIEAVCTLFDIPSNKVSVAKMAF